MTIVSYKLDKDKNFNFIIVEGHANYRRKGKDIVCSSISAILNGTINYLKIFYKENFDIFVSDAKIEIRCKEINEKSQACLELMIYQLENISKYYSKYISLTRIK